MLGSWAKFKTQINHQMDLSLKGQSIQFKCNFLKFKLSTYFECFEMTGEHSVGRHHHSLSPMAVKCRSCRQFFTGQHLYYNLYMQEALISMLIEPIFKLHYYRV